MNLKFLKIIDLETQKISGGDNFDKRKNFLFQQISCKF